MIKMFRLVELFHDYAAPLRNLVAKNFTVRFAIIDEPNEFAYQRSFALSRHFSFRAYFPHPIDSCASFIRGGDNYDISSTFLSLFVACQSAR